MLVKYIKSMHDAQKGEIKVIKKEYADILLLLDIVVIYNRPGKSKNKNKPKTQNSES